MVVEVLLPNDLRPMLGQPKACSLLEPNYRFPCIGFDGFSLIDDVYMIGHQTPRRDAGIMLRRRFPQRYFDQTPQLIIESATNCQSKTSRIRDRNEAAITYPRQSMALFVHLIPSVSDDGTCRVSIYFPSHAERGSCTVNAVNFVTPPRDSIDRARSDAFGANGNGT